MSGWSQAIIADLGSWTTQATETMSGGSGKAYPWYAVVSGGELQQGDILRDCPVFVIPPEVLVGCQEAQIRVDRQHVIVITQSCHLAIRPNGRCAVDDVMLAAVYEKSELAGEKLFGKSRDWEEARKGRFPAFHVLNRCEIPGHERDFMLVDFRKLFSLPIELARTFADRHASPRVRLLPPCREHLAQAFARFFMRVGLPVDIPRFA